MLQGAANYAWNVIEEIWGMIWSQTQDEGELSRTTLVNTAAGEEMRKTGRELLCASDDAVSKET